jgi:hypothetical protein
MRADNMEEAWKGQLLEPDETFFKTFAAYLHEPDGVQNAVREAVKTLIPLIDWEAYLPNVPHGLMGLRAVFRLRPLLAEKSFHRILATQLHSFAHEGRRSGTGGLKAIGRGSGSWQNVRAAIAKKRPSIAYGEMLGLETPTVDDFQTLGSLVQSDMANVGHKAVMAHQLGDLFLALNSPRATGKRMLALGAWLAATELTDTFWNQRASKRIGDDGFRVEMCPARLSLEAHSAGAREICDLGLVDLLDRFIATIREGYGSTDLLAMLVLAASEKQLDARRDLEGKTTCTFVYLATHAASQMESGDPRLYAQAAALVNLFPTDEEERRIKPEPPRTMTGDQASGLLDAILDSEPPQAMYLASALKNEQGTEALLRVLAEAASQNDPAFNHCQHLLSVAAVLDLLPVLPEHAQSAMLIAVTKFLANSQGTADLGRLAERALG